MNRLKKISLQMVMMAGLTLAMSNLGLAQQEAMPDHLPGDDEIAAQMATQQQNKNSKVRTASAHRQSKNRKHKQTAKQHDSQQPTSIVMARK